MRIVSLVPGGTDTVLHLGLRDSLVGVTHSCSGPGLDGLPRVTATSIPVDATCAEIDRAVRDLAGEGTPLYRLDVDAIAALAPDLILTQGVCDVCAVGAGQAERDLAGLPSRPRILTLHPHRFGDVLEDVRRVAEAACVPHRAERLLRELSKRVEAVRHRVAGRARVRVGVLEWVDPLFSAGHWTPDLVHLAGGVEVFARPGARSRAMRWEEMLNADPDVLLLACCGYDARRTREVFRSLRSRPGFDSLTACRTEQIWAADGTVHFSRPGPGLVASLEMLATALHDPNAADVPGLARLGRG